MWNENEAEHKEKKNTGENYQDSHAVRSKAQTAQETFTGNDQKRHIRKHGDEKSHTKREDRGQGTLEDEGINTERLDRK